MKELILHLVQWYQGALDAGGYPLVFLLMAIESTAVPVPSELVIPFAAQRAHVTGHMTMPGIVLAATAGSWAGAAIMYWASRWAGRPLALRYGKYFFVPEEKLHAAERWAGKFGPIGVFIARLLPVVRHLIGVPMGIVKMDFRLYSLFTLLGSCMWCAVLAWVGVAAGNDPKLLQGDVHQLTIYLAGFAVVLIPLYYFFVHRHMKSPGAAAKN